MLQELIYIYTCSFGIGKFSSGGVIASPAVGYALLEHENALDMLSCMTPRCMIALYVLHAHTFVHVCSSQIRSWFVTILQVKTKEQSYK